ncbi:MAG: serine protein kinase, partial [Calditrichia bacterium]
MENIQDKYFKKEFEALSWTGSFSDYLEVVKKNPQVLRTSYQRLYEMILSYGSEEYEDSRKKMTRYHFFADPVDNGKDAIYGLDAYLMKLMNIIKSAAHRYGTERRVILLHGPVGSSKST